MADPRNPLLVKINAHPAGPDLQPGFQHEVATLLKRDRRGFPGAQPVSFGARHIGELKTQDYYVCEKTDGIRYLMYLTHDGPGDIHYLIDRKNDYYYVPGLHFPHHEPDRQPENEDPRKKYHIETVLDGELVEDHLPDGRVLIKFLVFDCLVIDGQILMGRPLDKRLAYFKSYVLAPYQAYFKRNPNAPRPFVVEDKSIEFSYALPKMFHEIIPKVKQLHGNDGLIFTCKNTPYRPGTDEHILKWKPPAENTIDFLLHVTWATMEPDASDPDRSLQEDYDAFPTQLDLCVWYGKDEYERHESLYVTAEEWDRIKGLGVPLQHAVVECYLEVLDDSNGHATNGTAPAHRWRFHRLREDKEDANHISTYNSVIESIQDHITEKDLLRHADEIRTAWKSRAARSHSIAGPS